MLFLNGLISQTCKLMRPRPAPGFEAPRPHAHSLLLAWELGWDSSHSQLRPCVRVARLLLLPHFHGVLPLEE